MFSLEHHLYICKSKSKESTNWLVTLSYFSTSILFSLNIVKISISFLCSNVQTNLYICIHFSISFKFMKLINYFLVLCYAYIQLLIEYYIFNLTSLWLWLGISFIYLRLIYIKSNYRFEKTLIMKSFIFDSY